MTYSIWRRLLVVFVGTLLLGTCLAFAFQYADARAKIEPEPVPKKEPRPCSSVVKGQPVSAELAADCAWRERRDRALDGCYSNGGIPALGFGYSVVCVYGMVTAYDARTDETHWASDPPNEWGLFPLNWATQ